MEILIQSINREHAQGVQQLSGQLGYPLSLRDIENNITEIAATNDHIAFAALLDGKVAGWIHAFKALLLESQPFVEIGGLVVDENHRGRGIGKQLIERIKEWSREKGINEIRVRSHIKRIEAHRFYINNGFTEIKSQKVFLMNL